jgi:DNA integrity scanning protein DisA with diadenylate cyclase activity
MTIAVLKKLCSAIPWCEPEILEQTVELALEIAREGREGRRIGTLFTLGAAEAVLAASRPLILDPLGRARTRADAHQRSRPPRHDQGVGAARWCVCDLQQ